MISQSNIAYQYNNQTFEGVLVSPNNVSNKLPALLMVPNWLGITKEAIDLAKQQAEKGYIVFIVDLYGKTVRPQNSQQADEAMTPLKENRQELRQRMNKALDILLKEINIDKQKIAAFGFCFGGCCTLELARSGADIKAAISFHGNLDTPNIRDAQNIKGSILVLNGANDPMIPDDQITDFFNEMKSAPSVDWQFINYGGAVHGFTDVTANDPEVKKYNEKVSKRAFNAMNTLLDELFK